MSALTGKHVLVLGLGESGLAMARWCALRGARVRVADSRATPPGTANARGQTPAGAGRCLAARPMPGNDARVRDASRWRRFKCGMEGCGV
jgi:UDP-N-acetylmuramoylalanine--D-glutamate ligase